MVAYRPWSFPMQRELEQILEALETGMRTTLAHLARQSKMTKDEIEEVHARVAHLGQLMHLIQQTLIVNWPEQPTVTVKQLKNSN